MTTPERRKHIKRVKELIRSCGLVDIRVVNNQYGIELDLSEERIAPVDKRLKKWFYKKTNKKGRRTIYLEFYPNKLKHKESILMGVFP